MEVVESQRQPLEPGQSIIFFQYPVHLRKLKLSLLLIDVGCAGVQSFERFQGRYTTAREDAKIERVHYQAAEAGQDACVKNDIR